MSDFVAIDFETADYPPDSACAIGVVRVRGGSVAEVVHRLIRPPRPAFRFTRIHGIDWGAVRGEPPFGEVWPAVAPLLDGAEFIAAHNAPFDRNVLRACCEAVGQGLPPQPFLCTVRLARAAWGMRPANLAAVCARLDIPLQHHRADSDALASARIVLAARAEGRFEDVRERCFPGFRPRPA